MKSHSCVELPLYVCGCDLHRHKVRHGKDFSAYAPWGVLFYFFFAVERS
jgi:hypothetical protein